MNQFRNWASWVQCPKERRWSYVFHLTVISRRKQRIVTPKSPNLISLSTVCGIADVFCNTGGGKEVVKGNGKTERDSIRNNGRGGGTNGYWRLTLLLSLITATLVNWTSLLLAVIWRFPIFETSAYYRPSEPFLRARPPPQLSTDFEDILSRVRVNFEKTK